ncbi:hypothetical protein KVR01_009580 [Diaporthe batatas]|uniref:uncharacterized protein n=1 Tax=Diaporthe batatas TaxID=748121 RepID=UPI001D05056D|nr:uncharacterized protein KVR01_009580 [Diaporthe batatas]KAG8161316.1 hypothetical protein KVR01_009580 [Diaporthe batatas]
MAPIALDQMSPLVTLMARKIKKQKKTKGGNLPKPVLIAIVVVVVVLLVIAIALPIIQKRRKARREANSDQQIPYSKQDSSNGLYQRMSTSYFNMFGGPRTGGNQQAQGVAAHERQRRMDGGAGQQGADFNALGSGGPGSDGRVMDGSYVENGYPPR